MPYATAAAYLQKFGLAEATQALADEESLLTEQLLKDAMAVAEGGAWTGDPTEAEQAAAVSALERLERQLAVTSNFMDGYLRAAVTLPLADADVTVLEDCCMALVRYELHDDSDNATERMDEAAKRWCAWLRDVQAGRVTLSGAGGEAVPSRGRTKVGQAVSGFNWSGFGRA
jgi:phage gp36-like protein